jgi:hypothetical protein
LNARPERARRHLGHLLTPHNQNRIAVLLATGLTIDCDNSCFGGLDLPALTRMLEQVLELPIAQRRRIGWCAVPDVVADHRATLRQFGRRRSMPSAPDTALRKFAEWQAWAIGLK